MNAAHALQIYWTKLLLGESCRDSRSTADPDCHGSTAAMLPVRRSHALYHKALHAAKKPIRSRQSIKSMSVSSQADTVP